MLSQIHSLIQQVVVISSIASVNTDMTKYNKKGEIRPILNNIFTNTSISDLVHTLIPALVGTPMNITSMWLYYSLTALLISSGIATIALPRCPIYECNPR